MDPGSSAPLGIALLGLLLGMRHATDPDHVIAVTAILSRERRLASATRIGVVWGLGHTLTVLAVGAAIIIFKLAVPIRLGLAMEFAVALVLILLGLGSVGALVRRIVARLFGTPVPATEGLRENLPEDLPEAARPRVSHPAVDRSRLTRSGWQAPRSQPMQSSRRRC